MNTLGSINLLVLSSVAMFLASAAQAQPAGQPTAQDYTRLADEVEAHLQKDVIHAWFPRCINPDGGFHANWDRQWRKRPSTGKFIVFQSRQTWISAQIAMNRPELRQEFLGYTRHGVKCLNDVMWDREHGGFYWGVEDNGSTGSFGTEKHLYGEAFGMYAAAAAYEATHDPQALDLAVRAFKWLEEHAHDAKNGGYHETYTREGKIVEPQGPLTPATAPFKGGGFIYGYKSMNAHIHLLEALAALHRVWKDPLVTQRLEEVHAIVRDRIAVEPGCMSLWFTLDWRAVPDHDSIGHDVETGFLLIEAAEELGKGEDPKTLRMARMLVDHALDWAWDDQHGGFYDKAYAFTKAFDTRKVWWAEVEGVNSLLLMHQHFGNQTDRYWKAFQKQWQFVSEKMIDSEFAGFYPEVEADGKPAGQDKGNNWKAGYHDGRSLLLASARLRALAGKK